MTRIRPFLCVLFLLGFCIAALAEDPVAPPPPPAPATPPPATTVTVTVELTDGSRIIGTPIELEKLPLKVEFGKLEIPMHLVGQAGFTANRAAFQIKLKNNDTYTGSLELERMRIQTAYGEASVPVARINRITVKEVAGKP